MAGKLPLFKAANSGSFPATPSTPLPLYLLSEDPNSGEPSGKQPQLRDNV